MASQVSDQLHAERQAGPTDARKTLDSLCRSAAAMLEAPIALIVLRDEQGTRVIAGWDIDPALTCHAVTFFEHVFGEKTVVIHDLALDERFASHPLVTGQPLLRFCAGVPLVPATGQQAGALCVLDTAVRNRWPDRHRQLQNVAQLAQVAEALLGLQREDRLLRERLDRYQRAAQATRDAVWDLDLASNIIEWADVTHPLIDFIAEDETLSTRNAWLAQMHPDDRAETAASFDRALASSDLQWHGDYRCRRSDGSYAIVLDRCGIIRSATGQAMRVVGARRDVTECRRQLAALRANEKRLQLGLKAGRMVAWERDLKTGCALRSDHSFELLGIGSGSNSLLEHVVAADRARVENFLGYGGTSNSVEFRYQPPGKAMMWLCMRAEQIAPDHIVGITFDITDQNMLEERLRHLADHDSLTGLPNRALFYTRLERALAAAEETGTSVSLLLLDLDNFKDVNDTLGHDIGDVLLHELGTRLSRMVRSCDTAARLGGDEFAMVIVEPLQLSNAANFADFVIDELRKPFSYQGRTLSSRATIGIAAFPDHHRDLDELMKDADIALHRAKAQGRNRAVIYNAAMRAMTERRVALAVELRKAIEAGRIVPFYQPKVCFATSRIIGFEALVRWQHPVEGVLTPARFQSAFEDPELTHAIGSCLMPQIARDMRDWLDRGLDFGRVAFNLASSEFERPDLVAAIQKTLRQAGVPNARLEVEVTETVFFGDDLEAISDTLARFREADISVALDDFGTGYASLTHLKKFLIDRIKIDRSFINGLEHNEHDAAIVRAVIGLGKALNMKVTAEGVETIGQSRRLRSMGCDDAQGYLFAKPMIGSRIPWLLKSWSHRPVDDGCDQVAERGSGPRC